MGMASRFRGVQLIPGAKEKGQGMDPLRPYLDPTQVPLGEKPKTYRVELRRGNSQISPVTSGKGVPEPLALLGVQVAVTRGRRLFTKNIGGCKPERV